jgi:membrane protease YdiL (CAAX protease family)
MWTPGDSILYPTPDAAARAWSWPAALAAGLAAGGVAIGLSEALTRWTRAGQLLADRLAEHLARSLGPIGLGDAWLLALASGLAEEMFFRGAMQAELGIVMASLAFGAAHFLPRRDLVLWSVYAVAMGAGLGALYDWTGQLVAPIAAHVLVNGINLPRLSARSAAQRDRVDLDPGA